MKIICVRFQNINSLKGKHEINFGAPPFDGNGLFAITGPTGAGKTSILDAITVALYGRVHRHDKDAYECMTRHTAESFAEVEFEAVNGIYRSKWSIKRSFGKVDGTLQSPKMELSNALTGEIIISHPLNSVQQAIIETCGLDYNQFLRSVMLCQGDFTRFLKSSENERSQLLEKITDTRIYSDISIFIFQKAKEESNKLDVLVEQQNIVKTLSEEELLHIQEQLDSNSIQEKDLIENRNRIAGQLQLMGRLEEIQAKLKEISINLPHTQEKHEELTVKVSVAEKSWHNSEKHQKEIYPIILETEKQDLLIINKRNEIGNLYKDLESQQATIEKHQENIINKKSHLSILQNELQKSEQDIHRMQNDYQDILSGKSIEDLENESAHLPHLISLCEKQLETSIRIKKHNNDIFSQENQLFGFQQALDPAIKELPGLKDKLKDAEEVLNILQKQFELELLIRKYDSDRKMLRENEACPLCGSISHPFIESDHIHPVSGTEKKRDEQKRITEQISKQINEQQLIIQRLQTQIELITGQIANIKIEIESGTQSFLLINEKLPKPLSIENNTLIQSIIDSKKNQLDTFSQKIKKLRFIEQQVKAIESERNKKNELFIKTNSEIENIQALLDENNKRLSDLRKREAGEQVILLQLKEKRSALFGDKDTETERKKTEEDALLKRKQFEQVQKDLLSNKQLLEILRGKQNDLLQEQKQISENIRQIYSAENKHILSEKIKELELEISKINQEVGRLKEIVKSDSENKRQHLDLNKKISIQRKEADRWRRLDKLIGSAEGKKFSRYAQGITLTYLTELANRHLEKLSDRYRISKVREKDLELEIIDHYQADIIRPMNTLSGGESFLVSLALALGLSELASKKTPIHSLFIDEGFGTLDSETLETAIAALENLQSNGKVIGIISHVDALKERIGAQIQVDKQTGGHSILRISNYGIIG